MRRPNLFILGAPKCGTTAMATWLSAHPEVFVSPVKEPHYFSEEHRLTPTLEKYEALFVDADPQHHRWVCEASVWHLFSDTAVPNILDYAPDARFIVMVRNPLDMAPSMHEQHRFNGDELVVDFAKALALNDIRSRGAPIGVRAGYPQPGHMAYYSSCALGWQVARLFEWVPKDHVHVIVHDDMNDDPFQVYAAALRFLDLPNVPSINFERINAAKRRKSFLLDAWVLRMVQIKQYFGITRRFGALSRIRRWNSRTHQRKPPPNSTLTEMVKGYADDVELLSTLIGRDLSSWLTVKK